MYESCVTRRTITTAQLSELVMYSVMCALLAAATLRFVIELTSKIIGLTYVGGCPARGSCLPSASFPNRRKRDNLPERVGFLPHTPGSYPHRCGHFQSIRIDEPLQQDILVIGKNVQSVLVHKLIL